MCTSRVQHFTVKPMYLCVAAKMNMRTPASLLSDDEPAIIPIVQNQEVDFSEYMWMEEMEEFDRQVSYKSGIWRSHFSVLLRIDKNIFSLSQWRQNAGTVILLILYFKERNATLL